jgi:hypothetical protein
MDTIIKIGSIVEIYAMSYRLGLFNVINTFYNKSNELCIEGRFTLEPNQNYTLILNKLDTIR